MSSCVFLKLMYHKERKLMNVWDVIVIFSVVVVSDSDESAGSKDHTSSSVC